MDIKPLSKCVIDLTGRIFGRLRVVKFYGRKGKRKLYWTCKCSCGNTVNIQGQHLRTGATQSCGCLQKESARDANITHGALVRGKSGTLMPTYRSWQSMLTRCTNKNVPKYKFYGGSGITVCERWEHSFENFLKDMGERPSGTSLDRINNAGNYEPSNCRWSTPKQQARNRRSNKPVIFDGKTWFLEDLANKFGVVDVKTVRERIGRKWPLLKALTTK